MFVIDDDSNTDSNTTCFDKCPEFMFVHDKKCVNDCPSTMFVHGNNCVNNCPAGTVLKNETCESERKSVCTSEPPECKA